VEAFHIEATSQTACTEAQLEGLFAEGFPAFITADQEVKNYIHRVRTYFPQLDIMLIDDDREPVATGWGVPITWNSHVSDLPTSFADILRRAVTLHEADQPADTFVICGGVVHPDSKGTGASAALVAGLCDTAGAHGLSQVIAPLRPTRKHLYPLTQIEDYATWVRDDGLPLDPWLRLHLRHGAHVIALAPEAQTMTGTVTQWQDWTGLTFPDSGQYVIPQGLSLLQIDRETDAGTYVEPNIWVRHR
jgi:hypothetical protein